MKKLISIIVVTLVLVGGLFLGLKYYAGSTRPALNGNEKIVSTSIDQTGKPMNVLGDVNEVEVTKDQGEVFLSIPVNKKNMKDCRVTLSFDGKVIDDTIIKVSEARYVTYHFEDIKNIESGFYQFAFYDDDGIVNVYAGLKVQ